MSRRTSTRRRRDSLKRYIATLPADLEEVDLDAEESVHPLLVRAWRSKRFTAQLFQDAHGTRLSVQRTEDAWPVRVPGRERPISWDELMEVKQQCGFGDHWAVEILPPDDQVVDVAPMRHLWILGGPPGYGWRSAGEE